MCLSGGAKRHHLFKTSTRLSANQLTKYLLFGSLNSKEEYTVKLGDTIESIAYDHKLNVDEFLIVNPEFTSKNNLLTIGQTVNVALISPIVKIVVEKTKEIEEPRVVVENSNLVEEPEIIEPTN